MNTHFTMQQLRVACNSLFHCLPFKNCITMKKCTIIMAVAVLLGHTLPAQPVRKLDFNPQRDGFHFANLFTNFPQTLNTKGLCGGMALSAFNYWRNKIPVPTHDNTGNYWPGEVVRAERVNLGVPPEGSALRQYIYNLQLSSYPSYLRTFVAPGFDNDENHFNWSLNDEFPRIVRAISEGKFVLLGLRNAQAGNLLGHQVLVYGYDKDHNRIFIYDPNFNDQEILIDLDTRSRSLVHKYANGDTTGQHYRSYFVALELNPNAEDLFTGISRPGYTDIIALDVPVVTNSPASGRRIFGESIQVLVRAKNRGSFPANVQSFFVRAITPDNGVYDFPLQASINNLNSIGANSEFNCTTTIKVFGHMAGQYQLIPMYRNKFGVPVRMCYADLSVNRTGIVEMFDKSGNNAALFNAGTIYRMNVVQSGKAVEVESACFANGRRVQQYRENNEDGPCAPDGKQQKWNIVPAGNNGAVVQYRLKNIKYNKCLDIDNNNLIVNNDNGQASQLWALEPAGNGQYYLRSVANGRYVQVNNSNNGEALTLGNTSSAGNKLFRIAATN